MGNPQSTYQSVLQSRYCKNSPLLKIFSEENRTLTWRQLWIWLAEAEMELGLKEISADMIAEMKEQKNNINWEVICAEERRLKHDVMAHAYAFGMVCPKAKGIIHLGATSCFVQDNSDLIIQVQALDVIIRKLAICLKRLAEFAERNLEVVTVGRTHYQPASLVTYGKRAVLWSQDLLVVFNDLINCKTGMRFRGAKGATGTQDSFLTLFHGDEDKVELLDKLVTEKAGFHNRFAITGQTYTRVQDCDIIFTLAKLGAVTKKICADVRILQSFGEILEPFESEQIGSSAMPYKRNPMKSERVCSLARQLINAPQLILNTVGDQGFERTLDDSAIRRMLIPDTFLTAYAVLTVFQNIVEGMELQKENIARILSNEIPFLCLERAMMLLCEEGADRQEAHHKIREIALASKELQKTSVVSVESVLTDSFFDKVRDRVLKLAANPILFTGRSSSQSSNFLKLELYPALKGYLDESMIKEKVSLDV